MGTRQVWLQQDELEPMILGESMEPGCHQVLEVEDDGKGMPPDLMARMFDPFFTTKEEGHGLGLAAMLGILKGHRAGALVSSWPGQGTRFRLFLPASQDMEDDMEETGMDAENGRSQGRILVVDDESSVRAVAEQVLKLAGHSVQTAENGLEALEILESGARFDLLLLDVSMPRMDGMELLSELVKKEIDVPILLMSGHAEQEIQKAAEEGLVKGIIGKPFGIQDLRKAVADLLP